MAYELEKKYAEVANDEELAIVGQPLASDYQQGNAGTGPAGTARELTSLHRQLEVGGNFIGSSSGDTTVDQLEQEIADQHGAAYQAGANPGYLVVSPAFAHHVGNMARASGRQRDIRNERRLVNVIDLYVAYFGELDVVLDRHIYDAVGAASLGTYYGLDFNYLATPVLRATRDYPLAKDGDHEKRQIVRESTFAVLNSYAHFAVTDIPTSLTY